MDITVKAARSASRPHRLVPVFSPPAKGFALAGKPAAGAARALARLRKFEGNAEQTLLLPHGDGQWLFAGLGKARALSRPIFCTAVARGLKELRAAGADKVSLLLPEGLPWGVEEAARWAAEALCMAGYGFRVYRSRNNAAPCQVEVVHKEQAAVRRGVEAGNRVGEAVTLTRDLINHPAGVAHTDFMVAEARRVARKVGATAKVIRGEQLLRQGYGAIHAVGRAAAHPPALVALEWGRGGRGRPTLALVGKGVVFDSGGLDLKTATGMALMKKDMSGSAIVLGAFQAIAALRLPLRVVAVLGLAENAVGPDAYHPGDVLRSKAGTTIEITNTDAEGRVVLADAMALARQYKPDRMVDFATLTGACRVALGRDLMGLFCDHGVLREALQAAAEATGEHLWQLPLWRPYRKKLDSPVADIANAAGDGMAGAVTAAVFLQEFAGDVAWAHLDCYGWGDGDHPLYPKGGSGIGVRLMVDLATRLSKGE